MAMTRRGVMWPLIIVVLGCVWLLIAVGAFPVAIEDILRRSWPALLVLFGLDALAGHRRVKLAGRGIPLSLLAALLVAVALVGIVWAAYRQQADVLRDDMQVTLDESLPEEVERLVMVVDLKRTAINVAVSDESHHLTAQFKGSDESQVDMAFQVEGTTARLAVSETYRHSIPRLDDYGQGTISLVIPSGVTIEQLDVSSQQGNMGFDLRQSRVQALAVEAGQGDVTLSVPDQTALLGDLRVSDGDLTVNVAMPLALSLSRGNGSGMPRYSYDADRYFLLAGGDLKRQNVAEYNVALTVWMNSGSDLIVMDVD